MDIDNTTDELRNSNVDIEQSLLQQFSCMGTTDKEELVSQLRKILGTHLNYSTAAFFLEMNNWNLQAAICSYFDVENSKLPSMALASDPCASETETIEPNSKFSKSWRVFNNGAEPWPAFCYVTCATENMFNGHQYFIDSLKPGENTTITLTLQSPPQPGTYQSKWRLCTPEGAYFGDPMWIIMTVLEEGTVAITDQLSHFNALGARVENNVPLTGNPFSRQIKQEQNGINDSDSNMC